jgi:hypothetical protein
METAILGLVVRGFIIFMVMQVLLYFIVKMAVKNALKEHFNTMDEVTQEEKGK